MQIHKEGLIISNSKYLDRYPRVLEDDRKGYRINLKYISNFDFEQSKNWPIHQCFYWERRWLITKKRGLRWNYQIYRNSIPEANDFELCILAMRNANWTFAEIQRALGNPSKKVISSTLRKFDSSLVEKDVNKNKLNKQNIQTEEEGVFRYNCIQSKVWNWIFQGEKYNFSIKNNKLMFSDETGYEMPFSDLDVACRNQMLNEQQDQIKEHSGS